MATVLLTGATGYVGQEVLRQLLDAGHAVTALGRTRPTRDAAFVQADLTDAGALAAALANYACDAVIHLASLPGDTSSASASSTSKGGSALRTAVSSATIERVSA